MRLHSSFRDYYDHAIGYGVDESVHYDRHPKEVDISIKSEADRPVHWRAGLLGFCGTIYPFVQLARYDKKRDCDYEDDFDGKIVEEYYAFSFDEYSGKEADWSEYSEDFGYSDHSRDVKLKQFFMEWHRTDDSIFLEHQTPVWLMSFSPEPGSKNGALNPILKDLGFDRMKDSFAAFQEISMYVANILVEQKPVASIDDKHRIEQHGFDLKTSFRNSKKKN